MLYGLSSKELNITYIADTAGVMKWINSLTGVGWQCRFAWCPRINTKKPFR